MPKGGARLRLGIDGREYQSPGATGIGRYLAAFIEWTAANRSDVTPVVFLNQRCRYSPPPRVEIIIIKENFTPFWDQVLLPAELKRRRIDVFLSPYVKMPMAAPCPVVLVINDLIPIRLPAESSGSNVIKNVYFRAAATAAVRRAAAIVSISEFTKKEIVGVFSVKPDKIRVVMLGLRENVKPVRDPEKLRAAASKFGLDGPYILYAGHLRASKNVDALIRAYAIMPAELRGKYLLAIAGRKTDEYPRLAGRARELGVAERVRFLDFLEDEYLFALMSGAALFAYPSLFEGFGYPPLEAMACGAPVVSSAAASLGEILGDAAVGVGAPTAENLAAAMRRVLEDEPLRGSLAEKGPVHAARFTAERMSKGFLDVIENAFV